MINVKIKRRFCFPLLPNPLKMSGKEGFNLFSVTRSWSCSVEARILLLGV